MPTPIAMGARKASLKCSRCMIAAAYAARPNHAPWPKDTSPVCPTRMLSAMHAIAKITTSVAEVTPRPMACSAKGSATRAATA